MGFCVECGSQEDLHGHLCIKCLASKALVTPPAYLSVVMCQSCGRTLSGAVWDFISPDELVLGQLEAMSVLHPLVESVRWEAEPLDTAKGEHGIECRASITAAGAETEKRFRVAVRVRYQVCPTCSRQKGSYYEAVLQLRKHGADRHNAEEVLAGIHERILDMVEEAAAGGGENAFLTRHEPVRGGIDYYLGSLALARSIAAALRDSESAALGESSSLVGMRDGQELHRWTILARLPDMARGDVVAYRDGLWLVESVTRRDLALLSLDTGLRERVRTGTQGLRQVASRADMVEAVVVSHDADTIQVLEPDTMRTITLARPPPMEDVGETVLLVHYREEYHPVPW